MFVGQTQQQFYPIQPQSQFVQQRPQQQFAGQHRQGQLGGLSPSLVQKEMLAQQPRQQQQPPILSHRPSARLSAHPTPGYRPIGQPERALQHQLVPEVQLPAAKPSIGVPTRPSRFLAAEEIAIQKERQEKQQKQEKEGVEQEQLLQTSPQGQPFIESIQETQIWGQAIPSQQSEYIGQPGHLRGQQKPIDIAQMSQREREMQFAPSGISSSPGYSTPPEYESVQEREQYQPSPSAQKGQEISPEEACQVSPQPQMERFASEMKSPPPDIRRQEEAGKEETSGA
jgi:hypothetical protein